MVDERELSRLRAMDIIRRCSDRLVVEHPEIADLYVEGGDFKTYLDIANSYLGDRAITYPHIASRIVGDAIRKLLPKDVRERISKERSSKRLEELFGGFKSEAFSLHSKEAAKIRHEKAGVDVKAMICGRRRTPWSREERSYVVSLLGNEEYQHKDGSPNYGLIADEVNRIFHHGDDLRYANSVGSFIRDVRRGKNS